jgi:hypothetical protein
MQNIIAFSIAVAVTAYFVVRDRSRSMQGKSKK